MKKTNLTAVAFLLLFAVALFSFAETKTEEQLSLSKAQSFLTQQAFDKAIEQFQKVLSLNPQNDQALFSMAFLSFQLHQDYDKSLYYASKVSDNFKNKYLANIIAGHCLAAKGKTDEAISNFEIALKTDPDDEDSLMLLGTLYFSEKGNPAKAKHYFERLLQVSPNHEDALLGLGLAAQSDNQTIKYMEKLIEINPNHPDAYATLATSYGNKGDFDTAITNYKKAIKLSPNDPYNYQGLGLCYKDKGNSEKALEFLKKAAEINTDSNVAKEIEAEIEKLKK
ncbi:MAG: tetratricopeptide repeat protein [Candidatus Omnitrophica bacterium]|nr:tetratricopeptide repeat protein [Candidatus Omnitrophota bacterium]